MELERGSGGLGGVQQEGRGALHDVRVPAGQRALVVPVEALQVHAGHLVQVLGRREQHGRLGQVGHGVELAALHHGVVQFVELFPTGGGHFSFRGAALLVSRLAFRSLKGKIQVIKHCFQKEALGAIQASNIGTR